MRNKKIIVIPARMQSTRLPGKPLIKIGDKTILERVYLKCLKVMDKNKVYVATESKEIVDFCKLKKIKCINTGKAKTALDRIGKFSYFIDADVYINVQGDEPIINLKDVRKIVNLEHFYKNKVVFGKAKCNQKTFNDHSKAKVVVGQKNKVLYSGRGQIPMTISGKFLEAHKAVWIYSLPKKLIRKYLQNGQSKLEKIEGNEILRFLEMGIDTYAINLIGDNWAVDEKKDLKVVERILNKESNKKL